MGFQVVQTPLFKSILRLLFNSVPEFYGERTIANLLDSIDDYVDILSSNPFIGQLEPGFEDLGFDFRRIVVKPYFKIIYLVKDDYVYFLDLWDTRQDPQKLLNRTLGN